MVQTLEPYIYMYIYVYIHICICKRCKGLPYRAKPPVSRNKQTHTHTIFSPIELNFKRTAGHIYEQTITNHIPKKIHKWWMHPISRRQLRSLLAPQSPRLDGLDC